MAVLGSIGIVRSAARAADFPLGFGTTEPLGSPINNRAVQAFDRIRQETNGRVDIKLFPNNQLGGLTAMFSQVRSGALTFVTVDGITLSAVVPVSAIAGVGFAFKDIAQGFRAFDGDLGAYVRKDISAKNLYVHDRQMLIGMRQITANPKPIHVPDDLRGFKVRTPPGRLSLDLFRSFGGSPVAMDIAEVYTSLQTHIIDGQENPLFLIEIDHFFEVQKYLSLTNHQWSGFWVCGNLEAWNAIPADLQAVITRNFTTMIMRQRVDVALMNDTLLDKLRRRGLTVNTVDPAPFRAMLGSFYQHWKGEFGDKAWALLEQYTGKLA